MIGFRSGRSWVLPLAFVGCLTGAAPRAWAQARGGLPLEVDTFGVLSAVRAIDFRQVCLCPTVVVDSLIRIGPTTQVWGIFALPVFGVLTREAASRLRLARHGVVRSAFDALPAGEPDQVSVFLQIVGRPTSPSERRVAVIATPPDGITKLYLVRLVEHRGVWRALEINHVLEP